MNELVKELKKEFRDEDYRYAYDEEFSNARMATQIKVLREQRELKQAELAERAGMRQSRISELENVNYNSWSISTLRRLAKALGVRLFFGFESWAELLPKVEKFSREELEKPSFDEDPAFQDAIVPAVVSVGLQKALAGKRTDEEEKIRAWAVTAFLATQTTCSLRSEESDKLDDIARWKEKRGAAAKLEESSTDTPKRGLVSEGLYTEKRRA